MKMTLADSLQPSPFELNHTDMKYLLGIELEQLVLKPSHYFHLRKRICDYQRIKHRSPFREEGIQY